MSKNNYDHLYPENQKCWIDGHCHLCNEPLSESYSEEIARVQEDNIRLFISTALNPAEIDWHLEKNSSRIKLAAGIHPFYNKSDHKSFDYLVEQCENDSLWGIGEIGFDKRKNNHNFQKTILYRQLELAEEYDLPVIFHIVGRFNELYQALKNDFPAIRGMIHGFNGSYELVEMFSRLNVGFSIGYKMLQKKNYPDIIGRIVKRGLLFFETDAPFQKLPASTTGYLAGLKFLIDNVSQSCNLQKEDLLDLQWQTYTEMKG